MLSCKKLAFLPLYQVDYTFGTNCSTDQVFNDFTVKLLCLEVTYLVSNDVHDYTIESRTKENITPQQNE